MPKATVTFENEKKDKKAILEIDYSVVTGETKLTTTFEPEIKPEEQPEFYIQVMASFMRDIQS